MRKNERRFTPAGEQNELTQLAVAGLRMAGDGHIVGYGAIFNAWANIGGMFRERVLPGAFAKTLGDGADVRALFNHDANLILGRTRAGTLALVEDDLGLRVDINPPAAGWVDDLRTSIERGDISGMSFMFETVRDVWRTASDGANERDLVELKLFEVGPVTFPAYEATSVAVRTMAGYMAHVRAAGVAIPTVDEIEALTTGEGQDQPAGAPAQVGHPRPTKPRRHRLKLMSLED